MAEIVKKAQYTYVKENGDIELYHFETDDDMIKLHDGRILKGSLVDCLEYIDGKLQMKSGENNIGNQIDLKVNSDSVLSTGTGLNLIANIPNTTIKDGYLIKLKLHTNIQSNATLNLNNMGAKPILDTRKIPIQAGAIKDSYITLIYNGDFFIIQGEISDDKIDEISISPLEDIDIISCTRAITAGWTYVPFPRGFTSIPKVVASSKDNLNYVVSIKDVSTNGFYVALTQRNVSATTTLTPTGNGTGNSASTSISYNTIFLAGVIDYIACTDTSFYI